MNTDQTTATNDKSLRQSHYVGVTLSIDQYNALRDEARAEHRSVSSQLRSILTDRYGNVSEL